MNNFDIFRFTSRISPDCCCRTLSQMRSQNAIMLSTVSRLGRDRLNNACCVGSRLIW